MECVIGNEYPYRAICDGVSYVKEINSWSSETMAIAVGGTFFLGVLAVIFVKLYLNRQWRRNLIETGNEKAYLDIIKSKKVYRVQDKGSEVE